MQSCVRRTSGIDLRSGKMINEKPRNIEQVRVCRGAGGEMRREGSGRLSRVAARPSGTRNSGRLREADIFLWAWRRLAATHCASLLLDRNALAGQACVENQALRPDRPRHAE